MAEALHGCAGSPYEDDPLDPRGTQGRLLQPGVLGLAFRDPCIAQYHASSCCRNPLPLRATVDVKSD